eukprot:1057229_1
MDIESQLPINQYDYNKQWAKEWAEMTLPERIAGILLCCVVSVLALFVAFSVSGALMGDGGDGQRTELRYKSNKIPVYEQQKQGSLKKGLLNALENMNEYQKTEPCQDHDILTDENIVKSGISASKDGMPQAESTKQRGDKAFNAGNFLASLDFYSEVLNDLNIGNKRDLTNVRQSDHEKESQESKIDIKESKGLGITTGENVVKSDISRSKYSKADLEYMKHNANPDKHDNSNDAGKPCDMI